MPGKMKQDYFVVYSRILMGRFCSARASGAGGAGGAGLLISGLCGRGALEGEAAGGRSAGRCAGDGGLRAKKKYFIKVPVKIGNNCRKIEGS